MKAPHRRDISARQDLLGKELRQLFDDFTQEDMPEELLRLAAQLQGAVETDRPATGAAPAASASTLDGATNGAAAKGPKSSDPEIA
ncbi:hypothetical protein GCM10007301_02550 [Azorhizobium oxalatiphilum]|uniref:Anti-sigma factor NepR domain-containing protein n=2 Tax=Azorhizobium oxalatiphilum TaxID=980631 RepID=A0A917BIR6_9HYPH|nr:hypothetical protein GCM10007301_02550 [Azorhizobium oxalatiphilum]